MGKAADRLRDMIQEYERVELRRPTWVKMHPRVHMQLEHDFGPRTSTSNNYPHSPVMGLDVRIDAKQKEDYLEVGRGETP